MIVGARKSGGAPSKSRLVLRIPSLNGISIRQINFLWLSVKKKHMCHTHLDTNYVVVYFRVQAADMQRLKKYTVILKYYHVCFHESIV